MPQKKSLPQFLALLNEVDQDVLTRTIRARLGVAGMDLSEEELKNQVQLVDLQDPLCLQCQELLAAEHVHGMVLYACRDMGSSSLWDQKAVIFGPGCTFTDLETALWEDKEKSWPRVLDKELASTQKWPVAYYVKPEFDTA